MADVFAEAEAGRPIRWPCGDRVRELPTALAILEESPTTQIAVVLCALKVARDFDSRWNGKDHGRAMVAYYLVSAVMRRRLPFTDEQLADLIELLLQQRWINTWGVPVKPVLLAVERRSGDGTAPEMLRAPLFQLAAALRDGTAEDRETIARIRRLTGDASRDPLQPSGDPWTRALLSHLEALEPADRALAGRLLVLAQTASATKPSRKFLKQLGELIDETTVEVCGRLAGELLSVAAGVSASAQLGVIPPELGTVLRGLCWVAQTTGGEAAVRGLGDIAVAGWRKVPNWGPLCAKAANAAILALAELPAGASQLGRIRSQIKRPQAIRVIDSAIDRAAELLGVDRAEFEERVVPDFGIGADGVRSEQVGDYVAELRVTPALGCELRFVDSRGKRLKSVPAAIREQHTGELASLRQVAKDIKTMAVAQRLRLERLLLADRAWPIEAWRARYLNHALVGQLARRLIWILECDGSSTSVIWREGQLRDVNDAPAEPRGDTTVRLWHPVGAAPEEVKAWRHFLEEHELQQPFKQAHREVYLVTEAELETRTYSNRFAAHILRQHQMAALASGRGWHYALQGAWDQPDWGATLDLTAHGLQASFWIEGPWDSENWGDSGVFNHVITDQVRFRDNDGDDVPLDVIPVRVFSEVMRDVDLFVGVTSIGNDPTWSDQGDQRYRTYWEHYAFGELSEQASVRKEVLERLLPKLAIRHVAEVEGRFLKVKGRLRTYRIHLGSGNILMAPNDQYLCIVPDRGSGASKRVFLPFEGDERLAIVLSKAFLLARDDKITDRVITRQIRRR